MQPSITRQQLVGMFTIFEEIHQALKLCRVFRPDVGSLSEEVLRVFDTTDQSVHPTVAESGVDDDGPGHLTGRLQ